MVSLYSKSFAITDPLPIYVESKELYSVLVFKYLV